jgi:hypothetical protein
MITTDLLSGLEGVRHCTGGYTARCPAHDDRNPSLSIREIEDGRVLFHCFAGCTFDAIRHALASSWRPVLQLPRGWSGANAENEAERQQRHQEYGLRIWCECRWAAGTLAETYLRSRRIRSPVPRSLRFHPSLKHPSGAYLPAMVAAVQALDGGIVAVHRTYLSRTVRTRRMFNQ